MFSEKCNEGMKKRRGSFLLIDCFLLKTDSPPVIATSIRELLSLAHAHVGHCSRWRLVIHVLYSTVGHLSRGHERLIASRHCNKKRERTAN